MINNCNIHKTHNVARQNSHNAQKLLYAAERGDVQTVMTIIQSGLSADARLDNDFPTPLQQASQYGNTDVMSQLLDAGASVEPKKPTGNKTDSPLLLAAYNGHAHAVLSAVRSERARLSQGVRALSARVLRGQCARARSYGRRVRRRRSPAVARAGWHWERSSVDLFSR